MQRRSYMPSSALIDNSIKATGSSLSLSCSESGEGRGAEPLLPGSYSTQETATPA